MKNMGMVYHAKTITRREVEEKLSKVGDYVKIDFLEQCLRMQIDFDTKKFALLKLAEVYEGRKMFSDAARMMSNAAEINATYDAKMNDFMKSFNLFVKAGAFREAETSFTKALGSATELQKQRLKQTRKENYKAQASELVKRDRRSQAVEAYERLLELELDPIEKKTAQTTLLGLYEKLGKIQDFYKLKQMMG